MNWKVAVKEGDILLSPSDLVRQLTAGVIQKEAHPERIALTEQIANELANAGILCDLPLKHSLHMAFMYGYMYKVFLTKNKVEIVEDKNESNTEDSSSQDSNSSIRHHQSS